MEQKSSTPDPPEAGQDSPQEFADDDNGAKDSFSDSDNCVSQINNDNKKYPNGIETLKKVVPTTNGAVNMIEVKQNSNKTNEVHEAQIVLNDLSGMLVSESGRKHLRSKIIQIACSDDTSSEDELVENCPDNGNRNIDCHPSTAEAVDRTTEIASSEVEHRRSNLGLGKKYWFFDLGQFVKCQLFGCIIHELYSCQLLCDRCTVYIRKQEGGGYLLTIDEQRFVARVAIHPLDDLNLSNFDCFKRKILARIQVIRVLEDEMLEGRNQSATKFAKVLEEAVTCEINGQSTQVFLLCLSDIKDQEPLKSLELLSTNQSVPAELRSASGELLVKERSFIARNFPIMLRQNSSPAELRDIIQQFYSLGIERYGKWLMDYCPPALPRLKNEVEKLSPKIQLFVSRADVSVFHHLITIASEPEILPFFEYLLDDFFDCVKSINNRSSFADETPLVNPVLGFLFKSFWEIMAEIRRIVGTCDFKDLLIKRGNHWGLMDLIQWPIPQHGGRHPVQHVFRSLECQYQFVFKLMKHYYPSGTWKSSGFQYQMQLQNKKQPWWKQVYTTLTQGCNSHLKDVCEERKIWLYIMDHTIEQVVIDRICSFEEFFNYYEPVMIFHCKFVTKSIGESQESFRLATHSILKYIVQTSPFLHESDVGRDILSQQLSYLTRMVEKKTIDESPFSDIRDLITEYIKLWELRHELDCLHKGVPDFLAGQLNELVGIILRMVFDCLGESAPIKSLSMFLNRVNEFLTDFQNMALANAWYVKSKDPNHRGLTKVMNRIADEPDCSYLVTNVNTYLTSIGDSGRPPHYNIQIIRKLLDCVNVALEKTWVTDEEPVVGKLDAASTLLGAIRGSLIYMKEQPDYRDFAKYEKDSTKMFVRAVDTCPDLISFKKRVGVISESCWYLRKKDEIGVDRALEMLEPMFGDGINKNILEMCYLRYANKFLEHVENTASKDSTEGKILHIVNDLKSHRSENSVKKWDKTFKTETVPEILAGLSVIWSLMKSQDVTTGENLLQPHCIQILCALRLFGVDRDHVGAKSHLAQILTGQGKSVVLALVSAVFAVTGHNVFIACYSRYLVARDVSEFEDFFNALDLTNRVEYITINQFAEKCLRPVVNGVRLNLRTCLKNLVLHRTPLPNLASASFNFSKTILLVDEVDVFFSKDVYGSQRRAATTIFFPALAKVQEHMWAKVTSGDYNYTVDQLLEETDRFIHGKIRSKDRAFTEFDKILRTPGSFQVLAEGNSHIIIKSYSSNRELIQEHLADMARQAISVSKQIGISSNYTINKKGFLCFKDEIDGIFDSSYFGYNMSFLYFKLKSSGFDCKNGENYGYLVLDTGRISYAKLPTDFPLIVGVTGTLRNVYDHEKTAMREFYNIINYTDCPSFYGASIVKFYPQLDFRVLDSNDQWRRVLFERAYSQIKVGRAVMIFFERESEITSFAKDFGGKFAALNILTENTDDDAKDRYIDRAGATATLTLASRGIGRGTDFKSSLAVERNGGIHVVQSFFSKDQKEETQIKGRTARKDNKGSYELILCRQHLIDARLLDGAQNTAITYSKLDKSRTALREREGAKTAAEIKSHYIDHATTMKFFGLV
ncbi:Hypothetical protein NTJ_08376 [Nesidiocoris tenuis]|uniref:SecA family profile domain-containing protein n=1 Tax=Nesidiocoris tenuis TaxID=355587 RepID=A0ABN7AXG2_9HEMI|nr:Hypothetical protein NTJ_08376 [Nesidiocoris tenuis]